MSTQRRRLLEDDGGITAITDDGVYIEGLNSKFYTVDNWQGGNNANSIAVASGDVKFRIALTQAPSMNIDDRGRTAFEKYMTTASNISEAKADYDGAGNTAKMLQIEPSTDYAAGFCNAFTFPDGKTKGFLPSLGQWELASMNKDSVDAALSACGGTAIGVSDYSWSSTFGGVRYGDTRVFWLWKWSGGFHIGYGTGSKRPVRVFADLT